MAILSQPRLPCPSRPPAGDLEPPEAKQSAQRWSVPTVPREGCDQGHRESPDAQRQVLIYAGDRGEGRQREPEAGDLDLQVTTPGPGDRGLWGREAQGRAQVQLALGTCLYVSPRASASQGVEDRVTNSVSLLLGGDLDLAGEDAAAPGPSGEAAGPGPGHPAPRAAAAEQSRPRRDGSRGPGASCAAPAFPRAAPGGSPCLDS